MTVPATARRAGPFNGTGAQTAFPFAFRVFSASDLAVTLADSAGVETVQTLTTHYTVSINADQDATPGGTVNMLTAPTIGQKLVVTGATPYSQTLDLPAGGSYSPRALENALDRTVFQVQQLAEETGRGLRLPATAAGANTQLPAPVAGSVIGWDDTATGLRNIDPATLASIVAFASWRTDTFSGTGSQTAYTLASDPGNANNCDVSISGVTQVAGADFTVSGTTLTFASAPPAGTNNIAVRYGQALPVGTASAQDVAFLQSGTGAVGRDAQSKLREIVTPLDFMSPAQKADVLAGTQLVDVTDAFNVAGAASLHVRVPGYKYLVNDQIDIQNNQVWEFQGADIKHTDETKHILRANAKTGWSILGRVTLRGTLVTADAKPETGLYITDCKKYRVEGVTARNFKGKGIWLDGTNNAGARGDRGQFTDCGAFDCTVGRQIDAGSGAEYNTWTNFNASGCITGSIEAAGNNTTIGGSIVDNTVGVRLLAGANHCHGMYVGTNINHNSSANIWATGVVNGHTFVGCHAYGNGGSTGPIWFEGCKGVQFVGGVIDCWIYNDSGAGSGANFVTNNYFPGDYGVSLVSNNSALGQLYLRDNYGPAGPSALNDAAPLAALVTRGTNQSLTAGTAVKISWNTENIDNRAIHSAGDFTIPANLGTQLYEVSAEVYVSAASGVAAGGFAEVRVNGTARATWPVAAINATNASGGGGSTILPLASGDVVTLWVTANNASVTPVLLASQSRMSILLRS